MASVAVHDPRLAGPAGPSRRPMLAAFPGRRPFDTSAHPLPAERSVERIGSGAGRCAGRRYAAGSRNPLDRGLAADTGRREHEAVDRDRAVGIEGFGSHPDMVPPQRQQPAGRATFRARWSAGSRRSQAAERPPSYASFGTPEGSLARLAWVGR